MSEFASTIFACESALVIVNEHVIVEAVLSCKSCITDQTYKGFDTWWDRQDINQFQSISKVYNKHDQHVRKIAIAQINILHVRTC